LTASLVSSVQTQSSSEFRRNANPTSRLTAGRTMIPGIGSAIAFPVITGQRNNRLMRVRWTPCLDGTCRSGTWAISLPTLALVDWRTCGVLQNVVLPASIATDRGFYCFWKVVSNNHVFCGRRRKPSTGAPRLLLRLYHTRPTQDCALNVDTVP